ncbi:MAG TPA: hypothetical protein VGF48_01430 [Thermoanaerobaculia bacterium]|jgi:hypothetical protein
MNPKRKAEIQRRLSMASVPKPPEGLAERIKADLPKHFTAPMSDRQRHFGSLYGNLRVAASILLLVSAVYVTVQLLEPEEQMKQMSAARQPVTLTSGDAVPRLAERAIAAQAEQELRVEITQAAPQAAVATANAESDTAATFATARPREEPLSVEEAERAIAGGVSGSTADFAFDSVEEVAVAPTAVAAAAPAPPPVAPPSVAQTQPQPQRITATAEAPMVEPRAADRKAAAPSAPSPAFVREAQASTVDLGPRHTVFGISVDPSFFHQIKSALEHGERPRAESVNIGALVNYFAGRPSRAPKREVGLEVEGSPVPVGVEGRRAMIRFTIDTMAAPPPVRGTSVAPVAKDASIVIDLNDDAVTSFRAIGADATATTEDALLRGTSVTGLYEVELRPGITARERVATITLRYRSVIDGREHTIRKELRGRDFDGTWTAASRRHRLASLGAVWGETLKGTSGGSDVARRAEELASQSPQDKRAKELSQLAVTSSRMGT